MKKSTSEIYWAQVICFYVFLLLMNEMQWDTTVDFAQSIGFLNFTKNPHALLENDARSSS